MHYKTERELHILMSYAYMCVYTYTYYTCVYIYIYMYIYMSHFKNLLSTLIEITLFFF